MRYVGKTGEFLLRYAVFFVGLTILALGIVLCIQAQLGVSSWDVLQLGLSYVTPLSVGGANIFVGIVLVVLTIILTRKRPLMGVLINIVYVGACIDFIFMVDWIPVFKQVWTQTLMMLLGIGMMGFGSGMYVATKHGAGPRDGLTLALSEKLGWSIRKVRTVLEMTVLILGWSLGGPVFIGTVIASLAIGPMIQWSMQLWEKWIERLLGRGVSVENLNERALRLNHHDGLGRQLR